MAWNPFGRIVKAVRDFFSPHPPSGPPSRPPEPVAPPPPEPVYPPEEREGIYPEWWGTPQIDFWNDVTDGYGVEEDIEAIELFDTGWARLDRDMNPEDRMRARDQFLTHMGMARKMFDWQSFRDYIAMMYARTR